MSVSTCTYFYTNKMTTRGHKVVRYEAKHTDLDASTFQNVAFKETESEGTLSASGNRLLVVLQMLLYLLRPMMMMILMIEEIQDTKN